MAWGTGVSDAAPDATKSHRDAVNRDIEAMTTRANKRQASRNKPDEAERVAAMPLILKAGLIAPHSYSPARQPCVRQARLSINCKRNSSSFATISPSRKKELALMLRELAEARLELAIRLKPSPARRVRARCCIDDAKGDSIATARQRSGRNAEDRLPRRAARERP